MARRPATAGPPGATPNRREGCFMTRGCTPSSDAQSRARSVLSRRSGSRDLATASAGTTHRCQCVHVFVASLPTRLQWLAWAVLPARQHCAWLGRRWPSESRELTGHTTQRAWMLEGTGRVLLTGSECSSNAGSAVGGPRALQRVPFLPMPCMEPCTEAPPAKSESVKEHAQLTPGRQPRSAAVCSTTASLRVTLALVAAHRLGQACCNST